MEEITLISYFRGYRQYELSNHLGNVLATVSDKKFGIDNNDDEEIDYFEPEIITASDYYPFGMLMPGRGGSLINGQWQDSGPAILANLSVDDRTGNQPSEYIALESIEFLEGFESGLNDEFDAYITTSGNGGSEGTDGLYRYGFNGKENDNETGMQDYGFRIYNPGLGRFLSVDPIARDYSELTPYQFASNNPVSSIDIDGLEGWELSSPANNLKRQEAYYHIQLNPTKFNPQPRRNVVVSPTTPAEIKRSREYTEKLKIMHKLYNSDQGWSFRIFSGIGASAIAFVETETLGFAINKVGQGIKYIKYLPNSVYKGFTTAESQVINEAKSILTSKELEVLAKAAKEGRQASVSINGRNITFEPDIPQGQGYRAITNSEINGFHLGIDAFKSPEELTKTILHELHRLRFSEVVKTGQIDKISAKLTTQSADEFANSAQVQVLQTN